MHETTRVVILGDSITVGAGYCGVTPQTSYVNLLRNRLRTRHLRADVIPSALDGVDTGYAKRRFQRMVGSLNPDHVLVLLGANDARLTGNCPKTLPGEYKRNLQELVERILELEAKPMLARPNPRFDSRSTSPLNDDLMGPYAKAVSEVAECYLIGCVNIYDRFRAYAPLNSLIPDGIHPNPTGQQMIADAVAEELIPLLQQTDDNRLPECVPTVESAHAVESFGVDAAHHG